VMLARDFIVSGVGERIGNLTGSDDGLVNRYSVREIYVHFWFYEN
jgi:hypothetical protein